MTTEQLEVILRDPALWPELGPVAREVSAGRRPFVVTFRHALEDPLFVEWRVDAEGKLLAMVGKTLGHHGILGKIGAASMGEMYRAHDERLDRLTRRRGRWLEQQGQQPS